MKRFVSENPLRDREIDKLTGSESSKVEAVIVLVSTVSSHRVEVVGFDELFRDNPVVSSHDTGAIEHKTVSPGNLVSEESPTHIDDKNTV